MITAADLKHTIDELDRDQLPAALVLIAARMAEPDKSTNGAADEQLVDVAEAARMLGKSKSWVYHNHKDLPFTVNGIGAGPRFSKRLLEQYIAKHGA